VCWQLLTYLPRLASAPAELSGVVGIVVEGGRLAATGRVLDLAVALTISLAVLNLLPIPVLDGGQILLSCLEEAFPRMTRLRPAATLLGALFLVSPGRGAGRSSRPRAPCTHPANEERLARYLAAAQDWAEIWPEVQRQIERLPLPEAHRLLVSRAEEVLPFSLPPILRCGGG
jgi:membrane-associated protease RseP (regulator of RpoE activity)